MAYTPKKRNTKTIKIIIAIIVVAIAVTTFGVIYKNKEEDKEKFKVCGLSHNKTVEVLSKKHKLDYELNDYLFYGESLDIFHSTYDVENNDELSGKSIILKDICGNNEYSFVIRNKVDSQIILNSIKEGYYEIYVIEDLREKRAYFNKHVEDELLGVKRDGKRLQYTLLANQSYYKSKGVSMDKNYAFLHVQKKKIENDAYDVAIDPGALDKDFTYTTNKGSEANDLIEYKETYKAAQLLKDKLTEKGLKVIIVRKQEEEIDSYGKDGRLQRAYLANAKYYIRLSFNESALGYEGMDIVYSGHANGNLPKQLTYHLSRNSGVEISSIYNPKEPGIIEGTLIEGNLDEREVYDSDLWIREAGGKATQAGLYSENAKEGTAFFAKDNTHGMNAIHINLGYLTSKKDVDYWVNHKDEYMGAIATGMAIYLNIEES